MKTCLCAAPMGRRLVLKGAVMMAFAAALKAKATTTAPALPSEVAGIAIPNTPLAARATALASGYYPDFLFNHCLRTYLLGALTLKSQGTAVNAQIAFVAAMLHDLGLLPVFASADQSFEVDGADRAEALMHEAGRSADEGREVWNAIVMHDKSPVYAMHQSSEAQLLRAGITLDVVGPGSLDPKILDEVLQAFPRLKFKTRFTALLEDHCRRKPTSETETGWLDGLCRQIVADVPRESAEKAILMAPYAE